MPTVFSSKFACRLAKFCHVATFTGVGNLLVKPQYLAFLLKLRVTQYSSNNACLDSLVLLIFTTMQRLGWSVTNTTLLPWQRIGLDLAVWA